MIPTQIDILVRDAVVITQNADGDIHYDGAVAIDGGDIVAVGPTEEISDRYLGRRTLKARNRAVMPGLVDTHHHFLQNFLKGSRDDLALEDWISQVSSPRIVAAVQDYLDGRYGLQRHATRLGCVEALRSGVTCILNMEWATPPEIVDVYEEMGIRAVHALTLTDVDQWQESGMLLPIDEALDLADRLLQRCRTSRLVSFCYGLACPNSCSRELFERVRQRADEDGSSIHVHIAETEFEWHNIRSLYDNTPVGYLHDIGLLGPDVLGAHCIWLSDADIQLLQETGTAVSHNPECNMKVADGIAPVAKMLQAGVNVSLGTDSCAVNDNMDMFEAMRVAAFLQKVTTMDPAVLPAAQAFAMGTIGGARALGMADQIGSLEPGKRADLILVDLSQPHMRPINSILNNLVYAASAASDVETVIVDGKVVVEDRQLLCCDEQAVIAEAEAFAVERFSRAGLAVSPYYHAAFADKIAQRGEIT
jgi:5-methylthioadenosine/S-adenosylhomocysteine deaminase